MSFLISTILVLFVFIFQDVKSYMTQYNDHGKYSVFSWGTSQICCNFHPSRISFKQGQEAGGFSDSTCSKINQTIRNFKNSTVNYLSALDFPLFLPTYLGYPNRTRIILVTGLNDLGRPSELFQPGNRLDFIWYDFENCIPNISVRDFFLDQCLVHWYRQNYDLVGCNTKTRSTLLILLYKKFHQFR